MGFRVIAGRESEKRPRCVQKTFAARGGFQVHGGGPHGGCGVPTSLAKLPMESARLVGPLRTRISRLLQVPTSSISPRLFEACLKRGGVTFVSSS